MLIFTIFHDNSLNAAKNSDTLYFLHSLHVLYNIRSNIIKKTVKYNKLKNTELLKCSN